MKVYTGVGSRETPQEILYLMEKLAEALARKDYCLRSGGAIGADSAFAEGAFDAKGARVIYRPERFTYFPKGGELPQFHNYPAVSLARATEMASKVHPAWGRCTEYARALHARNCFQVLGVTLDKPTEFLVAWTRDGKEIGGTATALKLARRNGIPIYNLGFPGDLEKLYREKEIFSSPEGDWFF